MDIEQAQQQALLQNGMVDRLQQAPSSDRIDAERYRFLRSRLLCADFNYGPDGDVVLVFKMPTNASFSPDCDATIDRARGKS